ncbi:MAG: hypothetical protein KIH01_07615, partial [Candidatus Freyarchaeota archaeon]|nr:hypothetical protein [Candidatus Jordarchaeia archaeon]
AELSSWKLYIDPFFCHFQSVFTDINILAASLGRRSSSSIKEAMEFNQHINLSARKLLTTAFKRKTFIWMRGDGMTRPRRGGY